MHYVVCWIVILVYRRYLVSNKYCTVIVEWSGRDNERIIREYLNK